MLTREDIAAMRQADAISFHRVSDGDSFIRATKRQNGKLFSSHDGERRIDCGSSLQDYERSENGAAPLGNGWRAFDMIHCAQLSDEWRTIVGLLRTNDKLDLLWARGAAGTEGKRAHGLVGDRLYLRIVRDGKRPLSFFIAEYTGEDNTARMVRPY